VDRCIGNSLLFAGWSCTAQLNLVHLNKYQRLPSAVLLSFRSALVILSLHRHFLPIFSGFSVWSASGFSVETACDRDSDGIGTCALELPAGPGGSVPLLTKISIESIQ